MRKERHRKELLHIKEMFPEHLALLGGFQMQVDALLRCENWKRFSEGKTSCTFLPLLRTLSLGRMSGLLHWEISEKKPPPKSGWVHLCCLATALHLFLVLHKVPYWTGNSSTFSKAPKDGSFLMKHFISNPHAWIWLKEKVRQRSSLLYIRPLETVWRHPPAGGKFPRTGWAQGKRSSKGWCMRRVL